jgi:hypothetical protein
VEKLQDFIKEIKEELDQQRMKYAEAGKMLE